MKNNFFILMLFFTINPLFSQECYSEKNYPKYYFLNGVNVDTDDSKGSIRDLKIAFHIDYIAALYNPTNYQGQYNKQEASNLIDSLNVLDNFKGYGMHWSHYKKMVYRLYNDVWNEVFDQKIYEKFMIENLPKMDRMAYEELKKPQDISMPLVKDFLGIIDGHRNNVIFAHSQGNFVANQLCHYKEKKKIEIVSIASPAAELPCNSFDNYALFYDDMVIDGLRIAKPQKLKYDYLKPTDWATMGALPDITGHLVSSYLASEDVVGKMAAKIAQTNYVIYKKDMDFEFVKIIAKLNGKFSTNNRVATNYDPFEQKLCDSNMSSIVRMGTQIALGKDPSQDDNECKTLSQKQELSNFDKYKIQKNLLLGKTPIQIARTLTKLIKTPYNILSEPGYSNLLSKLHVISNNKSENNNLIREIASENIQIELTDKTMIKSINCLEVNNETKNIQLSLTPIEKDSIVELYVNNHKHDVFNIETNGIKNKIIGSISFKDEIEQPYLYDEIIMKNNNVSMDNKMDEYVLQCNTINKLRNSSCNVFIKYLKDKVIPNI